MIGRTLSHYLIVEKIGEGGMGVVYRAHDQHLDRDVAIKVLPEAAVAQDSSRRRFRDTALLLSQLDHPNICVVHDFDADQGLTFLVMEYVSGQTLTETMAARPMDERELIALGLQIAEALEFAHDKRVVHRDLKPSNVKVTPRRQVKVLDFGLARLMSEDGSRSRTSSTRIGTTTLEGTLPYMAPEQVQGARQDERTDLYALGVMLYQMATGRLPFEDREPAALLYAILHTAPAAPRLLRPGLAPGLDAVIRRCIEKRPRDRYASARQVAADLRALEGAPEFVPVRRHRAIRVTRTRIAVVLAVALGIAAGEFLFGRGPALVPQRIAVALFENQTGEPALSPLGRMAADWITEGLTRTGLLDVVPTVNVLQAMPRGSASAAPPPSPAQIREIAAATGAGTIVTGAYYLQGDSLRFEAQILDARRARLLYATDPVLGPRSAPEPVLERLRQRVTALLAEHFNPGLAASAQLSSKPPSLEAYSEYIQGDENYVSQRYREAIAHYLRAAGHDSTYTLPLLRAAASYWNLGEVARTDSLVRVLARSRGRLAPLDQAYLDMIAATVRGDLLGSYEAARRRAELAPASAGVYARALNAQKLNRPRESVEVLRRLDPRRGWARTYPFILPLMGECAHMLGDYRRQLDAARRGRRQFPDLQMMRESELSALAALGRVREVEGALDECLLLPPQANFTPGRVMQVAGMELRAHGHGAAARRVFDREVEWWRSRPPDEAAIQSDRAWLAQALYWAERWEESRALYEQLAREFPSRPDYLGRLGALAARRGNRAEALGYDARLDTLRTPYLNGIHTWWRALVAARLGERQRALVLLRQAYSQGNRFSIAYHYEIDLEPLRDEPGFKAFLRPKG